MDENWIIQEAFAQSDDELAAWYEGRPIVRAHRFPVCSESLLTVIFESVDSRWPQGVHLEADNVMEINGVTGARFILWRDVAPTRVLVKCEPSTEAVWVANAWDPSGEGKPELWAGCAAMIAEEVAEGFRYRCNDGFPDTDFDDIVFRIHRGDFTREGG